MGLLTAAGLSDKSLAHLMPNDKIEAINGLIRNFLEPAGESFVEELIFRFLLTRGDTLGGSMRNVGGALAQRKLTRAILSTLTIAGQRYHWQHSIFRQHGSLLGSLKRNPSQRQIEQLHRVQDRDRFALKLEVLADLNIAADVSRGD